MSSQAAAAPFLWTRGWGAKPSRAVGTYGSHSVDGISRFYELLQRWRAETYFAPLMKDKIENLNFKKIIDLGDDAVPLIIDEVRQTPDFLVLALYFITKENPVPPSAQGRVTEMVDAWLDWYARTQPHDN